jgi:Amt family ammonium transporter
MDIAMKKILYLLLIVPIIAIGAPMTPFHSDAQLAWLLLSTILVFFMAIPGLMLFYCGQVSSQNVLTLSTQIFIVATVMSLLWMLFGYNLVFTSGGSANALIGGLHNAYFHQFKYYIAQTITYKEMHNFIYLGYEMGFAIITPMLILGGFPERSRVLSIIIFLIFWEILVYYPIAHWVWGGGWLQKMGLMDFAGGTAVHINAGIAGLVGALLVGKRKGFPRKVRRPHNIILVAIGTSILWLGWFGFNSGAAVNLTSAMHTILTSYIAASCGGLAWILAERLCFGAITPTGILFGIVSGLVAITPACAYVSNFGAVVIGLASGIACSILSQLKYRLGYDDSLDAFGVHGFGGIIGSLLTAVFAAKALGGGGLHTSSIGIQFAVQLIGVVATIAWSGFITYVLLSILSKTLGIRVSEADEKKGLDIAWLNQPN